MRFNIKRYSDFSVVILLLAFISFTSCNLFCEEGNKKIVKQELTPEEFKYIASKVSADIEVKRAEKNKVIIEIEENLLDNINIKVKNNELEITSEKCFKNNRGINITVYTPHFEGLAVHGSGDVNWDDAFESEKFVIDLNGSSNVFGDVNSQNLVVKINGSGDVKIKGNVNFQEIQINGSGDYISELINGKKVEAKINGSGDISLGYIDALEANINGSGNIYYKGNPEVRKSIKGSGNISNK